MVVDQLDVAIVGAGFGGLYHLHKLRKLGYSVKLFEESGGIGGTWQLNRYPGVRVDSEVPIYQFPMEELWKDWSFSERLPIGEEIMKYFQYVDDKLDLSKDIHFHTRIAAAEFDLKEDRWIVSTRQGERVRTRFLILCIGYGNVAYVPQFPGLHTFKGTCLHTSKWPKEGVSLDGKRVGVIGTGASGVQLIQAIAPTVGHLTVFHRTPNMTLRMNQATLNEDARSKELYPIIFRRIKQTFTGFLLDFVNKSFFEATPEERRLMYEELWAKGGFHFWLSGYAEPFRDHEANEEVYQFWRSKVIPRINDPQIQGILAPAIKPYPWGTKRPALEETYYEVFNQPNVTLVDLSKSEIAEITPEGVLMSDKKLHELDVLVLATGFDNLTGSLTAIDIRGTDGVSLRDKWSNGVATYLGMATAHFPNMFICYGPQAPTAFCNNPTCVEIQGNWIIDCIENMKKQGLTHVEATVEAESNWTQFVKDTWKGGLWQEAKSWYMGANIPGKRIEPLVFTGGLPLYLEHCYGCSDNGYKGFEFS